MPRQPCQQCGTPIDTAWLACPNGHPTPRANRRRNTPARQKARARAGRDNPAVKAAMREAVKRDGRCLAHLVGLPPCPRVTDLTAHLPGGGLHPPDSRVYLTLCRVCHGRLDGRKSHG